MTETHPPSWYFYSLRDSIRCTVHSHVKDLRVWYFWESCLRGVRSNLGLGSCLSGSVFATQVRGLEFRSPQACGKLHALHCGRQLPCLKEAEMEKKHTWLPSTLTFVNIMTHTSELSHKHAHTHEYIHITYIHILTQRFKLGSREMEWWLRAYSTLAKDPIQLTVLMPLDSTDFYTQMHTHCVFPQTHTHTHTHTHMGGGGSR